MYEATTLRLSSYTTDLALVGANWSDVGEDVGEISATDGLLALCGGCKVALWGFEDVLCEICALRNFCSAFCTCSEVWIGVVLSRPVSSVHYITSQEWRQR